MGRNSSAPRPPLAAVLAPRTKEGRPARLYDAHDRPVLAVLAVLAAGTGRAGAAVDEERVLRRPLLDVADVGLPAVGAGVGESAEREVDRGADGRRQALDLRRRERARRSAGIDPGPEQRLAGLDVPHARQQRLIEE